MSGLGFCTGSFRWVFKKKGNTMMKEPKFEHVIDALLEELGDNEWKNRGDCSYVEHGGPQIRFDSDYNELNVIYLTDYLPNPDSRDHGYGYITVKEEYYDPFEMFINTSQGRWIREGDSVLNLTFTENAKGCADYMGLNLEKELEQAQEMFKKDGDQQVFADKVATWIIELSLSFISYLSWNPDEYRVNIQDYMTRSGDYYEDWENAVLLSRKDIEQYLLDMDADIEPEFTLE